MGAFTYPFAFLVTDVMNRVYGAGPARKVIFVGFVTGVICSLIGTQVMLQGDGYEYPAVAVRVAVASATGFLVAQLVDVFVFNRLRDGAWWRGAVGFYVGGVGAGYGAVLYAGILAIRCLLRPCGGCADLVGVGGDAVPDLRPRRAALGLAGGGGLGCQTCPRLDRPRAFPPHCWASDGTYGIISLAIHKICGTIILSAIHRKEVAQCLE